MTDPAADRLIQLGHRARADLAEAVVCLLEAV